MTLELVPPVADQANGIKVSDKWWEALKLRTVLTEPRRHELVFPDGRAMRLTASDFLSVAQFSAKYLDAVGSFPELPKKKPAVFLRDISAYWFEHREEIFEVDEASDAGALREDICVCLRSAPESDNGDDIGRGAIIPRPPAGALFAPRPMLDRIRRSCPIKFTPADFYDALRRLGCTSQGKLRIDAWQGRAWLVPQFILDDSTELM